MEEDDILDIIYDYVKATSNENFTTWLSCVKLTTGFEISKETYVELLKCASAYTHRFTEYLQITAKRTNPDFIPPLYKTHGVKGIVQYYVEGHPDKTTNNELNKELKSLLVVTSYTLHICSKHHTSRVVFQSTSQILVNYCSS